MCKKTFKYARTLYVHTRNHTADLMNVRFRRETRRRTFHFFGGLYSGRRDQMTEEENEKNRVSGVHDFMWFLCFQRELTKTALWPFIALWSVPFKPLVFNHIDVCHPERNIYARTVRTETITWKRFDPSTPPLHIHIILGGLKSRCHAV